MFSVSPYLLWSKCFPGSTVLSVMISMVYCFSLFNVLPFLCQEHTQVVRLFPTIFCHEIWFQCWHVVILPFTLEFEKCGSVPLFSTSEISENACSTGKVMKNSSLSFFSTNSHAYVLFSVFIMCIKSYNAGYSNVSRSDVNISVSSFLKDCWFESTVFRWPSCTGLIWCMYLICASKYWTWSNFHNGFNKSAYVLTSSLESCDLEILPECLLCCCARLWALAGKGN